MVIKKTTILAYLIVGMFLAAGIFPTITGQDEKDSGKATVTLIDEGFESGIPGSWINTGWVLNLYGFPHSGSNWAYTWSAGAELSIMALNFGENTELSFWYAAENSIEPMDLEVRIDDNAVWSDTGFTHTSYQQAVINLGSYSGDHTLSFIGLNDGFYGQSLDDILLTTEKDIEPPVISNVDATPPIQTVGQSVAISCDVTDNKGVDDVYVNITFPDTSENSYFMAGSGSYSYSQTYLQAGIHNYHIYAIDINGNSAESAIFSFEMNAPPVADFEYTPSSPTTADMVSFTDLSFDPDGTVVAWEWDFGDGGSSTVADPTHQFDDGSYLVSLTVTDDDDATDTYEETVVVLNIAPTADFEYTPSSPTTADTVSFTDLSSDSDGTVVAWDWDFGDGGSSTVADPTYSYDDDGVYTITLTVWDDDSGTDVHTDTITVTNVGPTADFEYTPSSPTTADTVSFTDLSFDPDGTIVAWDWDFGDGGSSSVQNPNHQYDDGTYLITLTVWDDDGSTDDHTDSITVTNAPPVADFEYTPSSPTTADMVSFTDLSFDPDGTIVAWDWDFGDGGSSTVADPTHQFDDGSYLVSLTVTDDNDATDTCEETVMVLNIEPVADFEYAPSSPTTADMVSFTDLSFDPDGTIVAWEWNFDDGGSSTIADPTHQFDDGTYLITLTVWDDDSGTDVHTDTITVTNIAPTADFEYTPSNPTTADTVSFTDLSSDPDGTIVAWDWDFGDGGSSTVADPTYSYDDDGVYTITLTVWDDDSGTDVHTDTITVTNVGPTADFTYFPIEPSILDTVDFTDTSIDPDGTIVAWEWDFDDGDTSTMQNPSHQFTTSGQYSVSLTVWDDDDATDTIIIPIDITPPVEVEDVNQSLFDRGFPIRHTWDGDWGSAQSFDTDVTTLTSAQIYLRKFGTPEFNLTVEIRKDHPEGTLIESMEFDIDDIPSTWTWLTVDFENFTVNPTTTYFIVLPPAPSSVSTSFGYEWGYTFGDVYSDGAFWFTRDGGDLWRDLPTRYDFTFITMGYVVN